MRAARLVVRLTPRAGQDRIDGWAADASGRPLLQARTTAPPTDGRANAALVRLIARTLGLPASAVNIASGAGARVKTLQIDGMADEEVRERLGRPTP